VSLIREAAIFKQAAQTLGAAHWRLYYARWERRKTLRLGGSVWTARAKIEPILGKRRARAYASIDFVRAWPTATERRALARDPRFMALASGLQEAGYERLMDTLERSPHLHRHIAATSKAIKVERERLDAVLGEQSPTSGGEPLRLRGFAAAIEEFGRGDDWRPAGAGWSLQSPPTLRDGTQVGMSILLVQRDDGTLVGGRELRAISSAMVYPKGRSGLARIRKLAPLLHAQGYAGGPHRARSTKTGRPSWLFGDFGKTRLGPGGIAEERLRLERLAVALSEA
jgi:hypothetical protein